MTSPHSAPLALPWLVPPAAVAGFLEIPRSTMATWMHRGDITQACDVRTGQLLVDYDHALQLRDERETRRQQSLFGNRTSAVQDTDRFYLTLPGH